MANKKISDLTDYTPPLDADIIPIVDIANGITKKVTLANLKAALAGYALQVCNLLHSPADATTYYIGTQVGVTPTTTQGLRRIYIPKAGTIKAVQIATFVSGTLGTAEAATWSIRLNNSGDTQISNAVLYTATVQTFSNSALSIAVVAGDYIEIKILTPTWVTNPTSVVHSVTIYIE